GRRWRTGRHRLHDVAILRQPVLPRSQRFCGSQGGGFRRVHTRGSHRRRDSVEAPRHVRGRNHLSEAPPPTRRFAVQPRLRAIVATRHQRAEEYGMAKGMERKKDTKKKAQKTQKEKRADKAAKKGK